MSFINEIAPHAQRIQKEYGILASLVIAQAIHESNWGKSGLAVKGNNIFGIKGSFNGQFVTMRTAEYDKKGNKYYIDAAFRKYPSWYESLCDLANLYKNGVSWDRKKYSAIIGEKDYKKAAKAVQSAGYATDPNYAAKVIATIESNNLIQYDGVQAPPTPAPAKPAAPKDIVPYPGHLIKEGSRGKDVERIQRAVGVNPDGIFGPNTKSAVVAYQKRHGLAADGIVGSATWSMMF